MYIIRDGIHYTISEKSYIIHMFNFLVLKKADCLTAFLLLLTIYQCYSMHNLDDRDPC
jgi:hypothetical protein